VRLAKVGVRLQGVCQGEAAKVKALTLEGERGVAERG
jgi:hypothetical protein